jgi:hypothetical protein
MFKWLERILRPANRFRDAGQSEFAEFLEAPCHICGDKDHGARRCRVCGKEYCGREKLTPVGIQVFGKPWIVHVHPPCVTRLGEMRRMNRNLDYKIMNASLDGMLKSQSKTKTNETDNKI